MKRRRNNEEGPKIWVVRLDERGYFGNMPWTPLPLDRATRMTAAGARATQNRMTSHNFNYPQAAVERAKEST